MTDERKPRVITLMLPRTDVETLIRFLPSTPHYGGADGFELGQDIEYQMNHQGRRVSRPIEADDG